MFTSKQSNMLRHSISFGRDLEKKYPPGPLQPDLRVELGLGSELRIEFYLGLG